VITITEVLRRSEQGVLRPFLCVGDNGRQYFVKGRRAGSSSLIAEWVCGNLGRRLGLPIPEFEIVAVPMELVSSSVVDGIGELGSGPAFGSEVVRFVQELGAAHKGLVSAELRRDILVFDRWIQNEDRAFSGTAGNPNLLWDNQREQLVVIDHNAAFDPQFDVANFWKSHAFRDERSVLEQTEFQDEQKERLEGVMQDVPSIIQSIPDEWHYEDLQQTVKTDFDFDTADEILRAFRTDAFWSIIEV
jgi:hypothetical protein